MPSKDISKLLDTVKQSFNKIKQIENGQKRIVSSVRRETSARQDTTTQLAKVQRALVVNKLHLAAARKSHIQINNAIKERHRITAKVNAASRERNAKIVSDQKSYIAQGVKVTDALNKRLALQNKLRISRSLRGKVEQRFNSRQIQNEKQLTMLQSARATKAEALARRSINSLQRLNSKYKKTKQALRDVTNETGKFGSKMSLVNSLVKTYVLYRAFTAVKNEISQAVRNIVDLQVKISEVRTISQEAQQTQKKWLQDIQALTVQHAHTTEDVVSGVYQTISNQIAKGAEAIRFMSKALIFANVTGSDTTQSVELLTTGLNAYSLSAAYANKVSASYFKTIELGRIRASEMANTVGRTVPLAAALGVELNEVNAALATMTIQGQPVNVSATLLRGILLKLIKPTKSLKTLIGDWGFESGEAAVKTLGFIKVLRLLNMEVLKGGQARIGELFGRERPMTGMATLARNNLRDYESTLKKYSTMEKDYANARIIAYESEGMYLKKQWAALTVFYQTQFAEPLIKHTTAGIKAWRAWDKDLKILHSSLEKIVMLAAAWYIRTRILNKDLIVTKALTLASKRNVGATVRATSAWGLKLGAIYLAIEAANYVLKDTTTYIRTINDLYNKQLGTTRKLAQIQSNLDENYIARQKIIDSAHRKESLRIINESNARKDAIAAQSANVEKVFKKSSISIAASINDYYKALGEKINRVKNSISESRREMERTAKSLRKIDIERKKRLFSALASKKLDEPTVIRQGKAKRTLERAAERGGFSTPASRSKENEELRRKAANAEAAFEKAKRIKMVLMLNRKVAVTLKAYRAAVKSGSSDMMASAKENLGVVRSWTNMLAQSGVSTKKILGYHQRLDALQTKYETSYIKTQAKKVKAEEIRLKGLERDKRNVRIWVKQRQALAKEIQADDFAQNLNAAKAKLEKSKKMLRDMVNLQGGQFGENIIGRAGRFVTGKLAEQVKRDRAELAKVMKPKERWVAINKKIRDSMADTFGMQAKILDTWTSKNDRVQYHVEQVAKLIAAGNRIDTERAKAQLTTEKVKTTAKEVTKKEYDFSKELHQTKLDIVKAQDKLRVALELSTWGAFKKSVGSFSGARMTKLAPKLQRGETRGDVAQKFIVEGVLSSHVKDWALAVKTLLVLEDLKIKQARLELKSRKEFPEIYRKEQKARGKAAKALEAYWKRMEAKYKARRAAPDKVPTMSLNRTSSALQKTPKVFNTSKVTVGEAATPIVNVYVGAKEVASKVADVQVRKRRLGGASGGLGSRISLGRTETFTEAWNKPREFRIQG